LKISDEVGQAQRDINSTVESLGGTAIFPKIADYEAVIELSYKIQVSAWWTVQPSVQRVIHPGARTLTDTPDATVFIVQTTLRF
jgi:carbohydrate-selective porin OprB